MTAFDAHYDVAVIGARPAGASLGARLGARGVRVLVVDRAAFPSPPAVPSSPTIHPKAMRLLDELGIDEASYGDPGAKMRSMVLEFGAYFRTEMPLPEMFGRDYYYTIDRSRLDFALWKSLARFPSVTARERFGMTDLIRDASGQVIGFEGQGDDGRRERIGAPVVIGADGRYSLVARKAGARVTEEHMDRTSTVYYAEWEDVAPLPFCQGPAAHLFADGRGTDLLTFPLTSRRSMFITHQRSDRVHVSGDAEAYYLDVLRGSSTVAARLVGAKRVTPVIGIKRIANRYLEAGGPGWALVGDAVHHKDPVDGQGIYDALIGAKLLADAIFAHREGQRWGEAVAGYQRRLLDETHGMYLATMDRLKRELYEEPAPIVIRTMNRWLVSDPEYKRRFVLFLGRAIPPEGWRTPALMRAAVVRGALRDVKALWDRILQAPRGVTAR